MLRKFLVVTLAALPLLAAAPAEPKRLAPVSAWVLDYAVDSCRLVRTFGEASEPTTLLFESTSPGSLSMLAIGKDLKSIYGGSLYNGVEIPARFLPGGQGTANGQPARAAAGKQPAVLWSSVSLSPKIESVSKAKLKAAAALFKSGQRPPPIDLAERATRKLQQEAYEAQVTSIEITPRRNHQVILQTGSLGRALKMLRQCTRDQLQSWGVDPNIEEKIVRPVWASAPYSWFDGQDYPTSSASKGEQSVVEFRLLVDSAGNPTKCTSLSHVDAPAFQKVVCDVLMRRVRFQPAELSDGTKVPSYYRNRIIWRLG